MLTDLVLPRRCVACGRAGTPWCVSCRPGGPALVVSGGPVAVRAAGPYEGPLRDAVLHYKERGRRDLAGLLAGLLALTIGALRPPAARLLLVPVPSARRAAAARGGDHMLRLARRAAPRAGARAAPGVLTLVRSVQDSAGLSVASRARNLSGAFAARRAPPGPQRWAVVLVDDVVTTGSTLREAHRALAAGGWAVHGAAVLAATPRRLRGGSAAAAGRSAPRTHTESPVVPLAGFR